jgi:hypothetical protein
MSEGRVLPLDRLTAGMRLAEAIRDGQGNLLLPAGAVLGEARLASLCQRGIRAATVAEEAAAETEEERQARQRAARARLEHLFRHTLDNPLNAELFEMMLEYRSEVGR